MSSLSLVFYNYPLPDDPRCQFVSLSPINLLEHSSRKYLSQGSIQKEVGQSLATGNKFLSASVPQDTKLANLLRLTQVNQPTNSCNTPLASARHLPVARNSRHCENSLQAFSPSRAVVMRQKSAAMSLIHCKVSNSLQRLGQVPSLTCVLVFSYVQQWETRTSALPPPDR